MTPTTAQTSALHTAYAAAAQNAKQELAAHGAAEPEQPSIFGSAADVIAAHDAWLAERTTRDGVYYALIALAGRNGHLGVLKTGEAPSVLAGIPDALVNAAARARVLAMALAIEGHDRDA